jgi:hypothetical protein
LADQALNFASRCASPSRKTWAHRNTGRNVMTAIERRAFMQGAGLGALAFSIGGAQVMLTPRQARAAAVPLRTLNPDQAATLDAVGETFVPGAKEAGISNFVDQQISIPPE